MSKTPKSTTQTTKVELPPEIEAAAKDNIDIANEVAAIGYTPYSGPTIAGFSPQQLSAMQSQDQAMAAFGMPSAVNWQQQGGQMVQPGGMSANAMMQALTGVKAPDTTANGYSGYSGIGLMNDAIRNMAPAQRAAIESFVMNPVTGATPTSASVPTPETILDVPLSYARNDAERARIEAQRKRNAEIKKARQGAASKSTSSKSSKRSKLPLFDKFGGKFDKYLGKD